MLKENPTTYSLPLWRTAWRRLRRRPFQYILFIFGVALGVAMTVSIDLANGSASRAFQLSTDAITGKATHRIVGGANGVSEDVYRQLRVDVGFDVAAPVVEGYVLADALGEKPMRLVGVDFFAEPPFRTYFGQQNGDNGDGLTPFLTQANTVVLSASVAEQYDLALDDEMRLRISGRDIAVSVVGVLQVDDEVNRRALNGIIFTDIATAQEILGQNGRLSHIDLIATDGEIANLSSWLPQGLTIETASARSNAVQQMTAAFELNLTALSLLALVVGMFLIYNTVSFSVVQRRPLFGVLRCLGVTGQQLFGLILVEAAILSLIGSLLGLGLGVVLGRGMIGLVSQTINDLFFVINVQAIDIPALTLWRGLAVGILAALVASAVPAYEAMQTTPQSTLRRSTIEGKTQRLLPWLVVAWLVLGGLGVILLWWQQGGLIVAFAGLFAILIAFALLTPPLMAILMRGVTPISERWLGALGRMAPRDIIRSLSRTSIATAALMVSVSVIVGVSIMIGSFRQTVVQWLSDTLQADVYLAPPSLTASEINGTLQPEVVALASTWPGVTTAVVARSVDLYVPEWERIIELLAVDGDVSNGQRDYAWIAGEPETLWDRFLAGEGVLLSEQLLLKEALTLPPAPIVLETPDGPRSFPVLAVLYSYTSVEQGTIYISRQQYVDLWQDEQVSTLGLFIAPDSQPDEMVASLQEALKGRQDVVVQSNQRVRDEALVIFDRTFTITAALRLLAIMVAFIGVLSALMSLQLERTRELGVLRATGMTVRQLWQLTLLETGLIGSVAGLIAMPTGFALAWILIYVINVRSFGWTLQMYLRPEYFGQAFLVALIAALLAGIYPASRLGRMAVATALRQE